MELDKPTIRAYYDGDLRADQLKALRDDYSFDPTFRADWDRLAGEMGIKSGRRISWMDAYEMHLKEQTEETLQRIEAGENPEDVYRDHARRINCVVDSFALLAEQKSNSQDQMTAAERTTHEKINAILEALRPGVSTIRAHAHGGRSDPGQTEASDPAKD